MLEYNFTFTEELPLHKQLVAFLHQIEEDRVIGLIDDAYADKLIEDLVTALLDYVNRIYDPKGI